MTSRVGLGCQSTPELLEQILCHQDERIVARDNTVVLKLIRYRAFPSL